MFYYHGDLQRCSTTSGPKWLPLRESTNPAKDGRLAGIAVGRVRDNTVVCCLTDKLVQSYVLNSAGQPIKTVRKFGEGIKFENQSIDRIFKQIFIKKFNNKNPTMEEPSAASQGRTQLISRNMIRPNNVESSRNFIGLDFPTCQ